MVGFVDGNRRAPLQERSRIRVNRILSSTAALLASVSPEKISMRKIATTANVSVGTIYQFFENKSAVIDALGESFEAAILKRCRDSITVSLAKKDLTQFVVQLMMAIDDTQREHKGFICIVRGNHHSHFTELVVRVRGKIKNHLEDTLQKAYPDIDQVSYQITVSIFESSAMAIVRDLPLHGDPSREQYLKASVEMLSTFLEKRLSSD